MPLSGLRHLFLVYATQVLLSEAGVPKISDFGLARWKLKTLLSTLSLEAGSLPYLAPVSPAPPNSVSAAYEHPYCVVCALLHAYLCYTLCLRGGGELCVLPGAGEPCPVQPILPNTPAYRHDLQMGFSRSVSAQVRTC